MWLFVLIGVLIEALAALAIVIWFVTLWRTLRGGEKEVGKLARLDRMAFGPPPEMFAEYREPAPMARCKEIERRIALSWLALSNARRNSQWVRVTDLEFGTIPRLERELADLRGKHTTYSPSNPGNPRALQSGQEISG